MNLYTEEFLTSVEKILLQAKKINKIEEIHQVMNNLHKVNSLYATLFIFQKKLQEDSNQNTSNLLKVLELQKQKYQKILDEHQTQPIDPYIKSTCEMFALQGFITSNSCSAHEKNKHQHWYIQFFTNKNITNLNKTVSFINKKHSFNLQLLVCNLLPKPRYILEFMLDRHFNKKLNNKEIKEICEIINYEFTCFFSSKQDVEKYIS